MDVGVSGAKFGASAVPSLKQFLRDVSKAVPSPKGGTVYEAWQKADQPGSPSTQSPTEAISRKPSHASGSSQGRSRRSETWAVARTTPLSCSISGCLPRT